jgi:hypothetical protein
VTLPILKQYSKTPRQQTIPPSFLGSLARRFAASFTPSTVQGVDDPEASLLSGVPYPEGGAEIIGIIGVELEALDTAEKTLFSILSTFSADLLAERLPFEPCLE